MGTDTIIATIILSALVTFTILDIIKDSVNGHGFDITCLIITGSLLGSGVAYLNAHIQGAIVLVTVALTTIVTLVHWVNKINF